MPPLLHYVINLIQNKSDIVRSTPCFTSPSLKNLVKRIQCLLALTHRTLTRSPITFIIRFSSPLKTRVTLKTILHWGKMTLKVESTPMETTTWPRSRLIWLFDFLSPCAILRILTATKFWQLNFDIFQCCQGSVMTRSSSSKSLIIFYIFVPLVFYLFGPLDLVYGPSLI